MVTTVLTYLAAIFITHHITSLLQASLHCVLGHQKLGGSLYKNHLAYHHGIYSGTVMVSDKYLDEEKSLTLYYCVPVIVLASLAYVFLPIDLFLVHVMSMGLSFSLHVYLHVQFHFRDTWLKRFEWFERKRKLHLLHHKDMFKNYSVVEFFWDRVLGTYQEAQA